MVLIMSWCQNLEKKEKLISTSHVSISTKTCRNQSYKSNSTKNIVTFDYIEALSTWQQATWSNTSSMQVEVILEVIFICLVTMPSVGLQYRKLFIALTQTVGSSGSFSYKVYIYLFVIRTKGWILFSRNSAMPTPRVQTG